MVRDSEGDRDDARERDRLSALYSGSWANFYSDLFHKVC